MPQDIEQLTQSDLFKKIGHICALVNIITEPHQLLDTSLKETMALFRAARGSVFILDEQTEELVLKAAVGLQWAERDQLVKKLGEGVVGTVAQMKMPIVVKDIASDGRFENLHPRNSYQTSSFICAPLLLKDTLIGVINIADKSSGQPFGEEELQLLDFLATQIALNFRRIQLYQKLQSILKTSKDLKDELGKSCEETTRLQQQVIVHERLATLGKLAGGIAHEFNNPLDGVMRYTNLCLQHVGEDDMMRGYLLEIKQGLNRMANIVRSLLACSRGESKDGMQRIDPNTAVMQAVESMKINFSKKNIVAKKFLSAGLPLIYDAGFDRIVENLLRNAIDAVLPGGEVIVSTALTDDGQLMLTVADNGCGISGPDDFSEIFQPFYTTKTNDRGCGLGLTIVSEIVKSYDGEIHVESEVGRGTKFIITFPL